MHILIYSGRRADSIIGHGCKFATIHFKCDKTRANDEYSLLLCISTCTHKHQLRSLNIPRRNKISPRHFCKGFAIQRGMLHMYCLLLTT